MNHCNVTGNLGGDPVTRATTTGKTICTFNIAVKRRFDKDTTDWFKVNAWGKLGELCEKYLKKGAKCAVSGSVQINNYTDREGVKRVSVEINADEVEFMSAKQADKAEEFTQVEESELPF